MKRGLVSHGVCLLLGSVVTLAIVLWLQRGMLHAVADGEGTPKGNGDVNGDGAINLTDAIYLLQHLFQGGPAPVPIECPQPGPCALPSTGQTKCYDYQQNEVPCDSTDFPGQDGFYQASCPSEGRFVDHGDGTVTDTCTGLMWQKDTALGMYNWQIALLDCEGLTLAGHTDWRLPNLRELLSIVDYGRVDPAIDPVFAALTDWYWSSSTYVNVPGLAWCVYFSDGGVGGCSKDNDSHVRAVRGGL